MSSPTPATGTNTQGSSAAAPRAQGADAGDKTRAAQGPIPDPVSAAANPVPASATDSPAEAEGRRTLTTAFVMVGPDGHLTIELRSGRVLVLRNVVMRPKDYCGSQVVGPKPGSQYCGGYAEVIRARAGGAAVPQ